MLLFFDSRVAGVVAGPLPLPTTHEGTIAMGGWEGERTGAAGVLKKEWA